MSHEKDPTPTPIPTAGKGQFANTEIDPQLASFGMKREAGHPHQIDVTGDDTTETIEVHIGLKNMLDGPIREPLSDEQLAQRRTQQHLEDRRATEGRNRTIRGAALGALATGLAVGALYVGFSKDSDRGKIIDAQNQELVQGIDRNLNNSSR